MIKRSRLSHGEDKSRTAIGEDCGVKALWSEGVVERTHWEAPESSIDRSDLTTQARNA